MKIKTDFFGFPSLSSSWGVFEGEEGEEEEEEEEEEEGDGGAKVDFAEEEAGEGEIAFTFAEEREEGTRFVREGEGEGGELEARLGVEEGRNIPPTREEVEVEEEEEEEEEKKEKDGPS